jgi:hypothetical protein
MNRHTGRLLPDGWKLIEEHRATVGRTLFSWLAFLLSLLVVLLVTASLLPEQPLLMGVLAVLITFAYFRNLRPLPGSGARLLLCQEGIVYSEWPFRALSWKNVRETELIAAGETGVAKLHGVIAELLARHHPASYPGRRVARGLSATGL